MHKIAKLVLSDKEESQEFGISFIHSAKIGRKIVREDGINGRVMDQCDGDPGKVIATVLWADGVKEDHEIDLNKVADDSSSSVPPHDEHTWKGLEQRGLIEKTPDSSMRQEPEKIAEEETEEEEVETTKVGRYDVQEDLKKMEEATKQLAPYILDTKDAEAALKYKLLTSIIREMRNKIQKASVDMDEEKYDKMNDKSYS